MKTQKQGRTQSPSKSREIEAKPAAPDVSNVPLSDLPSGESSTRVSIGWSLDEKGKIDFSRMRGKTKDQLRELLSDPETAKALGISKGPDAGPHVDVFDPEWCGKIYDGIARIEILIAEAKTKLPHDLVVEALSYTKEEKEALAEPTAKVINKYAFEWMIRFKEEIALAFLFSTITATKISALKHLQAQNIAPEKKRTPNLVSPISNQDASQSEVVVDEVAFLRS